MLDAEPEPRTLPTSSVAAASLCTILDGCNTALAKNDPKPWSLHFTLVGGVMLGFWGKRGEQDAAHTAGPCHGVLDPVPQCHADMWDGTATGRERSEPPPAWPGAGSSF